MRSKFADYFNHDQDALQYDTDVLNEEDPIRAGYGSLLSWVAQQARHGRDILELGTGTGNLTAMLPEEAAITGVDISGMMLDIAQGKLRKRSNIEFVQEDLLTYLSQASGPFDTVVSTYAVHHLTPREKTTLFRKTHRLLAPGGVAVFGDLMFASPGARESFYQSCHESGNQNLVQDIEDEFFWDIQQAQTDLRHTGFEVETKAFSALSWAMMGKKSRLDTAP